MTDGTFDDETVHEWLADVAVSAWVSLHYESPSLNGLGRGEISGGGYVRQLTGFSVPSNRTIWSTEDARWSGLLPNRLTHFGIWDSKVSGKLRAYGKLGKPALIVQGGAYILRDGQIALSIA